MIHINVCPKKNLPVSMVTEKVRLVINLYNNINRLKTWQEYVDSFLP